MSTGTLWTIGHSTLELEVFIGLLEQHEIKVLADVRLFPMSRRYPHFNSVPFAESLKGRGVRYEHFPELGGRRKPSKESRNLAWRNEHFRGYADYMETVDFAKGIKRLTEFALKERTAVMCAEAVWWRCHRGLISDLLKSEGWLVLHIGSNGKTEEHPYTGAAAIVNGRLSYAGDQGELLLKT